jgi:hypothetical protein
MRTLHILLILLCAWALPATATVIHNESTDGDLDGVIGTALGNLGLGTNTIEGYWTTTPSADTDRFNVTLTAGLQIDSIVMTTTLENGEAINVGLGTDGNLYDDGFYTISGITGLNTLTATFQDTVAPTTGPLDTQLAGSVWDFTLIGSLMYNDTGWTTTITTSAIQTDPPTGGSVPLVGTLALLGLGIGSLGWSRRQHSRHAS